MIQIVKNETVKNETVKKVFTMSLFAVFIFALYIVNYYTKGSFSLFVGIYGSVMITYLLGKMALSFFYKPYNNEPPEMNVSVVIPSYNETGDTIIKTVESILAQTYPVKEIFVIDDGSKNVDGYLKLKNWADKLKITETKLIVHRLEKNQGKRHAQSWAFKQCTGDVIFTVDSDGYTHPDALYELIRPFTDKKVMAVTGHINARNRDENILTRLLDMRYDNAFRVERAAQSVTGNILVCSGPISCYRREVIMDNLEDYTTQTFLGEKVQYGDDRCLTNYAILKGKTVYQSGARCDTDVPNNLRQFMKQQIRWNKSFFRETLIAFKIGFKKPRTLVWVTFEMSLWILFGFAIIIALLFKIKSFGLVMVVYYLAYLSISAYARNVYYILKRPLVFLMAPIYGIIHLSLLFPLRIYALLTLKSTGWGTR